MSEWREGKLGDFITLQRGVDITQRDLVHGDVPVISSSGITGYHNQSIIDGPGVITGRKGLLGKVYYVDRPYWPHDTTLWVKDFKGNYPRFVYYFLKTLDFLSMDVGSSNPTLNRNHVHPIPVIFPPLSQQREIAAILSSLDDKIELNRQMNATLEATARAIFKSWFVDFDPVYAKANGEHPAGMDADTAALFPDSFEESALGLIPAGWVVTILGSELETLLGGTPSRQRPEYWEKGNIAWINSGKVNEFRIVEPSEYITELGLLESSAKLLPPRTTVLAITGATMGQVSLLEIEACANQSVVAVLENTLYPSEFIYLWLLENIPRLISKSTGAAQQHINKGNVQELLLLKPEEEVLQLYRETVKPIFDKIVCNCLESRNLANLRDSLLPKLISGQVRVGEA